MRCSATDVSLTSSDRASLPHQLSGCKQLSENIPGLDISITLDLYLLLLPTFCFLVSGFGASGIVVSGV